ncbi:hypothetical protein E2C01_068482 [Portunus trituberculatus]|uniref:Uncharacterized protein n=1 Tax=Portunus trituberculatus TaxID=210409 RepID=A0A5B7HVZ1_PORTR|nr:hypothetical protein [Portunus trituberculatus]
MRSSARRGCHPPPSPSLAPAQALVLHLALTADGYSFFMSTSLPFAQQVPPIRDTHQELTSRGDKLAKSLNDSNDACLLTAASIETHVQARQRRQDDSIPATTRCPASLARVKPYAAAGAGSAVLSSLCGAVNVRVSGSVHERR